MFSKSDVVVVVVVSSHSRMVTIRNAITVRLSVHETVRGQLLLLLLQGLVAVTVLNGETWVSFEVVPKCANQLASDNVIRVLLDQMKQENAISSQILIQKGIKDLSIDKSRRGASGRMMMMSDISESIIDLKIALNEAHARTGGESTDPDKHRVDG